MNRVLKIKAVAITGAILGFLNPSFAQNSRTNDDSLSETVIIVREFEPVIKDAKKINHQPVINNVDKKAPNFTYSLTPQNQEYQFNPDTIDAVKIKGEPLNKLYRAYLKAGMGSYLNNLGELHINSLRSRDFQWGLDVHHFASNGGIKDLPDNYFSKQNLDLYAKKMLKNHVINAGFIFDREQINKYGINIPLSDTPDIGQELLNDIDQNYLMYKGTAGIRSFISDSNLLNYKVNFNYHNLSVKPSSTKENNFLMTSQFSKYFGKEKGYVYLDFDYNKVSADSADIKANFIVKPSIDIEFKGEKWHLLAGFKMALENGDETRFYFFPNAEFKYNVVRNLIVPYIGVTGGIKRNSINSLRTENPFLYELPNLKNTRTNYDVYVGVRGLVSSNLSYNVSGGYKSVKDMVLYTSDMPLANQGINYNQYENVYQPVYDSVKVAHVSSQISYQREDKWNVMWRMNYNYYETLREAKAWNLPDFTSDVTLRYSLQDKIIAKSSITFMNSKYVKTSDVTQEEVAFGIYGRKIDPIVDFNVGLEYRFTKKVSAFLDVNNILSNNYEMWGNYQVQGINVLGGVTIAFWKK